jgi:hypothetical protein
MTVYGYARVSTGDQKLDTQLDQLKAAGCYKIFREKVSGARSDRPELAKALKALDQGDVLIVCRLDRLARSTRDLLNVLAAIGESAPAPGGSATPRCRRAVDVDRPKLQRRPHHDHAAREREQQRHRRRPSGRSHCCVEIIRCPASRSN